MHPSAERLRDRIAELVASGGPTPAEYEGYSLLVDRFHAATGSGHVSEQDRLTVLGAFGDAVSLDTIQGMVAQKPHGYAGDYEVIDRIYTQWLSPVQHLVNWDRYFHQLAAAQAVRNRKGYLHGLLSHLPDGARVLNVGSGPGRCILEWLDTNRDADLHITCVDVDPQAIKYARALNSDHLDRLEFDQCNALRYRPREKFDLVWAAGLFDYFSDRVFCAAARRLMAALSRGGEIVIGNFSEANPSRPYMELGAWLLHHRSESHLEELMRGIGAMPASLKVQSEPEGVNLFVHAQAE